MSFTQFTSGVNTGFSTELNENFQIAEGKLGEVRMFALSMTNAVTKATLQGQGWAICDGTTPSAQGISSATITTTPDLQEKFLRMSNDETSGATAGSDTHNHQWYENTGNKSYNVSGAEVSMNLEDMADPGDQGWMVSNESQDFFTNFGSTLPAYYEIAFFMKVKVIA